MKMQLPEDVSFIIEQLEKHGYEAYAVGGCVRDTMLGRVPGDWDITTSALPQEIKSVFSKTIDTGIQHGTVTVMLHHVGYEVTTYRIDGEYEDGRHPKEVTFTRNLQMDLERRDFTINAMAYNDTTGLVDIFEGVQDLHRGVIRCVGDAGKRFDEDALRMLRAIRFSGQLGFTIEEKTCQAIRERAHHLEKISAERIRVELVKLLVSPGAERLREAYTLGMTVVFLPEFDRMMQTEQKNPHHIYTVGEHSIQTVKTINAFFAPEQVKKIQALTDGTKEWILSVTRSLSEKQHSILSVAGLLHDCAKPEVMTLDEQGIGHFRGHPEKGRELARKILHRLTFDNETTDIAGRLILYHDWRMECTHRAVRRAVAKIGADIADMVFLMQYADILSQNPEGIREKLARTDRARGIYEQIRAAGDALTVKELAVHGKDLIRAGVTPGPQMGVILKELLEAVLEEPEKNTKESLLTLAEQKGYISK